MLPGSLRCLLALSPGPSPLQQERAYPEHRQGPEVVLSFPEGHGKKVLIVECIREPETLLRSGSRVFPPDYDTFTCQRVRWDGIS